MMTENAMTETEAIEPITPIESIHSNVKAFMDSAGVDLVFGEPVEKGETVIIPAAEIMTSMGFGMGGSAKGEDGGGGGGYSTSRPVAVVIINGQDVRVEPVVDVTKVALAFFTAIGFMVATLAKMQKGK
jgi:uncharacterized spore protein YtfJ